MKKVTLKKEVVNTIEEVKYQANDGTIEKIRKHEVSDYEKIIKIIEKISTRKLTCAFMTEKLIEELKGLKQMQDFCYKQIEILDEWASEQCRLLGKDKK